MVRPPAEPRRASRRPAVPPRAESKVTVFRARASFPHAHIRRADFSTDISNATGRRTVFSLYPAGVASSTFPDPRALTRSPPPKPERNPNKTRTPRTRVTTTQTRVDEDRASSPTAGWPATGDVWERVAGANWTRLHAGAGTAGTTAEATIAAAAAASAALSPRGGHAAVVLRGDLYVFGDTRALEATRTTFGRSRARAGRGAKLAAGASEAAPRSGAGAMAPDLEGGTFVIFGGTGRTTSSGRSTSTRRRGPCGRGRAWR